MINTGTIRDNPNTDINILNDTNKKNEFSKLNQCNYIYPEDLKLTGFSIFTLNIRSMKKNFDSLKSLIETIDKKPEIIVLTETWNTDKLNLKIEGYKPPITLNRTNQRGGGICTYVKHDIKSPNTPILTINNENIECITTVVEDRVIVSIYRPPKGNKKEFMDKITDIVKSYNNKEINIIGDFNINLTSENYEPLTELGLFPSIHKNTRITTQSATIIDNIMTNDKNRKGYIIPCSISDHFAIIKESTTKSKKQNNKMTSRKITNETIHNLAQALKNHDWNQILNDDNTYTASNQFHDILKSKFEEHIPLVSLKHKHKLNMPWMTTGLRISEKKERKLYVKRCNNPTELNIKNHKTYKKNLDKTKRSAKQNYYKDQFEISKNNARKTWELIQTVTKKKQKGELSETFNINNKITTNKNEIANGFNNYFNQIGNNLAQNIMAPEKNYKDYMDNTTTSTKFKFQLIDKDTILKIGKNMKPKSSSGPDNISSKLLKHILPEIAEPLTHIINLSLKSGLVPDLMKESIIIPIYKDGDPKELGNHRPISLLNSISKIYEKKVHEQLYEYVTNITS